MTSHPILSVKQLGFTWETLDPFLYCVHHSDAYPRGNDEMGPDASLTGRRLGQDFEKKDGWRMYHGKRVPGFPAHPHRGFETVTIVLRGFIDHSDSHGAAGRYGMGDVQWLTTGRGLQHAEMFPLLNKDDENPVELFQIWLNLPAAKKFVEPHFRMLWSENIPKIEYRDEAGRLTSCTLISGRMGTVQGPAPAPDSWASDPANDILIAILSMETGAVWTLPAAGANTRRTLYAFEGGAPVLDGRELPFYHSAELRSDCEIRMENNGGPLRALLLQGKPVGEAVSQYGPFVMNTRSEIQQAFEDYQQTEFGGWPWERADNVHPREQGRFARHADGRLEQP